VCLCVHQNMATEGAVNKSKERDEQRLQAWREASKVLFTYGSKLEIESRRYHLNALFAIPNFVEHPLEALDVHFGCQSYARESKAPEDLIRGFVMMTATLEESVAEAVAGPTIKLGPSQQEAKELIESILDHNTTMASWDGSMLSFGNEHILQYAAESTLLCVNSIVARKLEITEAQKKLLKVMVDQAYSIMELKQARDRALIIYSLNKLVCESQE